MQTRNVIVSWWEVGKETQSWIRIEPEKIEEGIETIRELLKWGYLRKDTWGNVMTISTAKGEIMARLKEKDITKKC